MKKMHKILSFLIALVLFIFFGIVLMMYVRPMKDVSLDLSLVLQEDVMFLDPEKFDDKGWTVYTCEGSERKELEPNGFGGYSGLEPGQTFYFSRMMLEDLDSPTIQIGPVNRTFCVWLDETLLYTDFPEFDNRIGYLRLPMYDWDRMDPIIISLPPDYQNRTLTIAQSFPEYTEANSVLAYPASVRLYCGFSYESTLISESFQTSILATFAFMIGVILLIIYTRNQDWGALCLALIVFLWMFKQLIETSFFWYYYETSNSTPASMLPLIFALALLLLLFKRAGKKRMLLCIMILLLVLSIIAHSITFIFYPNSIISNAITSFLLLGFPYWIAFISMIIALIQGTLSWRKENWFYQHFIPLAFTGLMLTWFIIIFYSEKGIVLPSLSVSLRSGNIQYLFHRTYPTLIVSAVLTVILESGNTEIRRRMEKRLLTERREATQTSYEAMYRQHEEIMKLRHDMVGHLQTMRQLSTEAEIRSFIDELIGQNNQIRSIIHTGNKILDIILNSRLNDAADAGIQVEITRSDAPEDLPISSADLSSILINILNNAITAAKNSKTYQPFIKLDIHTRQSWLTITCENSADTHRMERKAKKETVPKHGLGLKIISETTMRNRGLFDVKYEKDCYKIHVVLPLN